MDWLGECDGINSVCSEVSTHNQGDRIEVVATAPSKEEGKVKRKVGEGAMPVGRTQCTRWTQNNTLSSFPSLRISGRDSF
jgi:hypothetical protein